MTIEFNGEEFPNAQQFKTAYPAYRNYADMVKGGITTVLELEKAIKDRNAATRSMRLAQARKNNQAWNLRTNRRSRK